MISNFRLAALSACSVMLLLASCQKQNSDGLSSESTKGQDFSHMQAYHTTSNASPNQVYVKFKKGFEPRIGEVSSAGSVVSRTGISSVDRAVADLGVKKIERIIPYAPKFESSYSRHGLDRWYSVEFEEVEGNLQRAISMYSSLDEIEHVETVKQVVFAPQSPSYAYDPLLAFGESCKNITRSSDTYPFNDPMLADQWHYDVGKLNTKRDASIYLFDAWRAKAGDPRVLVAVVDGGVKFDHEDLVDNYWINEAEMNGTPGVDDDGNGYIDDYYGWNFINNSNAIQASSHGTHVAGTVAAVNNNGKGVCGVAGGTGNNDGTRIVSCQILSDYGGGATADAMAKAITYGATVGAVISQNSWGFLGGQRQKVVEDAIDYFIAEAGNPELFPDSPMKGGITVFGAGNDGVEQEFFPAAYGPAIAVASSDESRTLSSFSNYGSYVDITAPGGNRDSEKYMILSTNSDSSKPYVYKFGTSMASPHVSGVAALIVAANYGKLTSAELNKMLMESVDPFVVSGKLTGSGLLNATKFLKPEDDKKAPEAILDLSAQADSLFWKVPVETSKDRVSKYTIYYSAEELSSENLSSAGSYSLEEYYWLPEGSLIGFALSEIEGLDVKSKNYYAIVSEDVWGNRSELSNVIRYPDSKPTSGGITLSESAFKSSFVVGWDKGFEGEKTISLIDRSGRTVYNVKVGSSETSYTVDVPKIASGVYTVQVVGGSQKFTTPIVKL